MQANINVGKVVRIEKDIDTKEGDSVLVRFTFKNGFELRVPLEHLDYIGISFEDDKKDDDDEGTLIEGASA